MVIVLFYCVLITFVCRILNIGDYSSWKNYVIYIFPYLVGRYWYITCYIPLGVLQPYVNKMILSLTEKQHAAVCLVGIFLGFVPACLKDGMFAINGGYSFIWLLVCYTIGAFLKRIEFKRHRSYILILAVVVSAAALLCGNVLLYYFGGHFYQYFIEYNSPFILFMAICLLLLFERIQLIRIKQIKGMIALLSGVAFDVYIIHCHILIFDYIIKDGFKNVAFYPIPIIWVMIPGIAILIFVALAVIGLGRVFIFEKCHIDYMIRWIARKIDPVLYKDF